MKKKTTKEWTPFAEHEGIVYVEVASIMHPFCALADGLPLAYFNKKWGRPYMPLDDAIKWCEKEMTHHSREKYEIIIAVLNKAKAQNPSLSEELKP